MLLGKEVTRVNLAAPVRSIAVVTDPVRFSSRPLGLLSSGAVSYNIPHMREGRG
jgi:hypothetical protein